MSVEWMAEMTSLTEVVLVSKGCHVGRVNRPTPRAARGGHRAPWDGGWASCRQASQELSYSLDAGLVMRKSSEGAGLRPQGVGDWTACGFQRPVWPPHRDQGPERGSWERVRWGLAGRLPAGRGQRRVLGLVSAETTHQMPGQVASGRPPPSCPELLEEPGPA